MLVDFDGVYDPNLVNDRLLLGMKGEMAAFELSLLRQRSLEAIRQKAQRGELQFPLPVGLCWTKNGKIEMDPDRRIQESAHLVFSKMTELGSARQVLLWFRHEKIAFPTFSRDRGAWCGSCPSITTCWRFLPIPSARELTHTARPKRERGSSRGKRTSPKGIASRPPNGRP